MIPLVVTVESKDGSVRRYAFGDSPVRVGRSPFAELQLTEAFVSRWEGTLRFDENEVTYFHVSQTNPTYVDGRAAGVHEEVSIGPTTVLTLGELKLRFERTAVRDEDLRRKGKRQPIKADDETVAKTMWLDASKRLDPNLSAQKEAKELLPASQPAYVPEPVRVDSRPPPAAHESRPPPAVQGYESRPAARPASRPPEPGPSQRPSAPSAAPPPSHRPSQAGHSSPSQPPVLGRPSQRPAQPESVRPAGSDSVRIAREVRVLPVKAIVTPAHGNPRPESGSFAERPGVSEQIQNLMRPPGGFVSSHPSEPPPDAYAARAVDPRPSSAPLQEGRAWDSSGSGSGPRLDRNDVDALHAEYRVAWEELHGALARRLESTPEPQRRQMAEHLQRHFPAITQEPEYRALLTRLRLELPASSAVAPAGGGGAGRDVPEIGNWLRNLAEGVLPPKSQVDSGMTLQRVLQLLELLTQSFAEINDAQDNIRRHWLGRAPRASIMRSDNGKTILAYMLNPKANWDERLGEIESAISDVVMHELALFKATLEGARSLVESLSPQALAKAEGIDLAALEEGGSSGGFLGRLMPRDTPEGRLWRKFMDTYEGLMDGDRYQRLFLGRKFARTYLAAMGQRDGGEEKSEK